MRLFFVCLFLLSGRILAQPKGWQEFTIANGLSQGMIYDLVQDHHGYLWIATKDGLNRYDGYNFTVFTHDPHTPYTLSDDGCTALLVDRHGRLWVGTANQGLNLYDDRTGRFYHLPVSNGPTAGNHIIRHLFEAPNGDLWVVAESGHLFVVTLPPALQAGYPANAEFARQVHTHHYYFPPTVNDPQTDIDDVYFLPNGEALILASDMMYRLNWRMPQKPQPIPANQLATLPPYFFWQRAAIWKWGHGRWRTTPYPASLTSTGFYLKQFNSQTVALASSDHLWLMPPEQFWATDSLTPRNAYTAMPAGIYAATKVIQDQRGNIWVGTGGYGLRKFNPDVRRFGSFLPGKTLTNLFQDRRGHVYVRNELVFSQIDPATNQMRSFTKLATMENTNAMVQDSTGHFWVSKYDLHRQVNLLWHFSEDWQLLGEQALPTGVSFSFYHNYSLYDPVQHVVWLGCVDGKLLRFDVARQTFTTFSYSQLLSLNGSHVAVLHLYLDNVGTLWISTEQGLVRADNARTTPHFSIYQNKPTDRHSLSNNTVSATLDDPNEPNRYLWISTKGGGLERLDKQMPPTGPGAFVHFTEKQGLPNRVVYSLLPDRSGRIWMSTNRGLAQFTPKTGRFRSYTKEDGLQDNEFNTSSFARSPTGELLFGGINGLTIFRPDEIGHEQRTPPQAHIIGLRVNNEPVAVGGTDGILSESLDYAAELNLSHRQNNLTLEFGVMDFTNTATNRYRYRLEGIDNNWVEAGTNRFANYVQLPDGYYTLQMIGSADGEVWSKPVTLSIRVYPPFYRTWWAYLLYTLLAGALAWQFYRVRLARWRLLQQVAFEQREAARLAELDSLKTEFFTNISHEFRTPLTLLLSPLADIKERFPGEHGLLTMMERNGHRLLTLINQLLDLSRLEANQLRPEPEQADLVGFVQTLAASFPSLAEKNRTAFFVSQNQAQFGAEFDHDKLEKILTNLLSNAFKFTPPGGRVILSIVYPDNVSDGALVSVHMVVSDTGIGIPTHNLPHIFERFYQVDGKANRAYEGTGIGLALVSELVRVLGGTIRVSSTEGQGTSFALTMPVRAVSTVADAPVAVAAYRSDGQLHTPSVQSAVSETAPGIPDLPLLLLIDDNDDMRAYMRSIFQQAYRLLEARDGEEGLTTAMATTPDLVICDLMMPRLDGFAFCGALKTNEATSHIPVVMLTAKATLQDRLDGLELGADDYLTKPFNRDELRMRVRNLLEKQTRLRHYYGQQLLDTPLAVAVAGTTPPALSREDVFLQRTRQVVEQHLADSSFGVEAFSETMNLSQSQLLRKLKALTGLTAVEYLRQYRLERAAQLLEAHTHTVAEVAYAVGFESHPYFTKIFQERYGILPSAYAGKTAEKAT